MPRDTRTALLDVAEIAVRQRGYDGFSFADLAAGVGIRKASVHHHFPTKAALSADLVARYHARVAADCTLMERHNATASARLRALIGYYRDATAQGEQLCLCVALSGSRDSLPGDVLAALTDYRCMIIGWLETVFAAAHADGTVYAVQPAPQEAPALLATLEGAQLAARTAQDASAFDSALAVFTSRLA